MSRLLEFVHTHNDLCQSEWFKSDASVEMGRWKAQAFVECDDLVYWVAEQTDDAESPLGKAWIAFGGDA
jgi:hypothetical protein